MNLRPIIFSTPMVQAICDNRKTMTRRTRGLEDLIIDVGSGFVYNGKGNIQLDIHSWKQDILKHCPYGQVGDLLWVRETIYQNGELGLHYVADGEHVDENIIPKDFNVRVDKNGHYKFCNIPNIFMPKALARIWLEITDVRVERLHDISEEDSITEGIKVYDDKMFEFYTEQTLSNKIRPSIDSAKLSFASLWISINGTESWKANPWVWVIKFKVLRGNK